MSYPPSSEGPFPPPNEPGPYGGSPYGGVPVEHSQGTTILVLGILSLLCFGIILGPIAWVMGNNAMREIDQNPAGYSNRGTVVAGRICGIIGTVLGVFGIIYFIAASG
jgi:uncharacterized protein DUF4190